MSDWDWRASDWNWHAGGERWCDRPAIVMWWSLLPQVPMTSWIVLVAVRMVSTRLPLVPNKDLAFAAVTVALIGSHNDIAPVIVMITTMVLLANIVVAIGISLLSWGEALNRRRLVRA
ncbi:MAG: hypothetical protein J7498_15250 [Sphingobium sp.]|nr:hypothetical protein [Sphingobium sp.]